MIARLAAAALATALLALPAAAQEPGRDEDALGGPPEPGAGTWEPAHAVELALDDDGLALGYRNGLHRGHGYFSVGFFAGNDDDYVLTTRLMRFGEPAGQSAFGFGVGLGLLGATIEESESELVAITLTGAAEFAFDEWFVMDYRARIGAEVSFAPDESTFADGRRVVDAIGRVEVDLSAWATAIAGYRFLELDIEDEEDVEVDRAFHFGVRLGF